MNATVAGRRRNRRGKAECNRLADAMSATGEKADSREPRGELRFARMRRIAIEAEDRASTGRNDGKGRWWPGRSGSSGKTEMIRWLTQESARGTSGLNIEATAIIAMQNAALQVRSVV
jgi:hypothetical protein